VSLVECLKTAINVTKPIWLAKPQVRWAKTVSWNYRGGRGSDIVCSD